PLPVTPGPVSWSTGHRRRPGAGPPLVGGRPRALCFPGLLLGPGRAFKAVLVGAVAEGLILRHAAAAKGEHFLGLKAVAFRVQQDHGTAHPQGSVVPDLDDHFRHRCSPPYTRLFLGAALGGRGSWQQAPFPRYPATAPSAPSSAARAV